MNPTRSFIFQSLSKLGFASSKACQLRSFASPLNPLLSIRPPSHITNFVLSFTLSVFTFKSIWKYQHRTISLLPLTSSANQYATKSLSCGIKLSAPSTFWILLAPWTQLSHSCTGAYPLFFNSFAIWHRPDACSSMISFYFIKKNLSAPSKEFDSQIITQ